MSSAGATPVVITRLGVVSPVGASLGTTLAGLAAGRTAIARQRLATADGGRVDAPAAVVDLEPAAVLGPKGLRYLDRTTLLLLCCLGGDLRDLVDGPEAARPGLVAGTVFGSLTSQIGYNTAFVRDGLRGLSAMEFPNVVINTPPSQANARFGLLHSSTTIASGDCAGLDAIGVAVDWIRAGRAERLLAAGCEALDAHHVAALTAAGALTAGGVVRPLDTTADGTAIGEGAAVMLLESAAAATAAGRPPVVEVAGWGNAFEPADDGSGRAVERAIRLALADAGADPAEVVAIIAAGDGDPAGDAAEATALGRLLGARTGAVPVLAPAGYWGRCGGAGGALAAVIATISMAARELPATPGTVAPRGGLAVTRTVTALPPGGIAVVVARGPDQRASALALREI